MLSLIIVNWNTRDDLRQCIESIITHVHGIKYEIIVVDNASKDKSAQMVSSLFPNITLLSNDTNLGFGTACNQGAAKASGEFIMFLNPDVRFESDIFPPLVKFLNEQPNAAIVAPKLLYSNLTIQPSVRRFPTPYVLFLVLTKLARLAINTKAMKRYLYANFDYQQLRSVDQVMGAAFIVKKSVFQEIGGFDSTFFLWFEEVDLCKRIKNAGYLIFIYPKVSVVHIKSRTFARQSIFERQKNFSRSARWYASKHFGTFGYISVMLASWISFIPVLLLLPVANLLKKYQSTEK